MRIERLSDRRRRSRNRLGAAFIVIGLFIVGSLSAVCYFSREGGRDDDLCLQDVAPSARYVVIVDVTDPYNPVQRTSLEREFNRIQMGVPADARFSLYTVTSSVDSLLKPLLSLCNPGSGEDASWLTENPERLRARWDTAFRAPIESVLDSIVAEPPSRQSPIMQTIQAVSLTSLHGPMANAETPRRLFIFSDLLEHTDAYSQYGGSGLDFADFVQSRHYSRIRTDLSGVEVVLFYVRREGRAAESTQGGKHIEFWNRLIDSFGGQISGVKRIEG